MFGLPEKFNKRSVQVFSRQVPSSDPIVAAVESISRQRPLLDNVFALSAQQEEVVEGIL